jgi:hypothetical protein
MQQKERGENALVYLMLANVLPHINRTTRDVLFWTGVANTLMYDHYRNILDKNRRWQWRPPPTFDALDEYWCWNILGYRKKHLWRIGESLLLPAQLQLENGSWTINQEMLIVLLLRFGNTDGWLVLESIILIEMSRMSRIFKVMLLSFV